MDDDWAQLALETVCRHLCQTCRDDVLIQLSKKTHAANQHALVVRRKGEQLQLEVSVLRMLSGCLLKHVRQLTTRLEMGSMA